MRTAPPAPALDGPGRVVRARSCTSRRSDGRAGAAPGSERGATGRGESDAAQHVGQRADPVAGRAAVTGGNGPRRTAGHLAREGHGAGDGPRVGDVVVVLAGLAVV